MYKLCVILLILVKEFGLALEDSSTSVNKSIGDGSKVLSRRKRYLIFPDGSSFQLVFCTQNHGYLQIGDIVWFGNIAALAWELPTDPKLFHFFKDHEKDFAQNRNGVSKLIYFLDQNGKVLSKVPYKRKPIVNPAFAKRSVEIGNTRKILHKNQKRSHYDHLDTSSLEFHRMARKSFYSQLEKFIKAIGWNGQECILRMLCEFGKARAQGMFLEEILRVAFTLPAGKTLEQYDIAHRSLGNCDELYRCEEYNSINIWSTYSCFLLNLIISMSLYKTLS